MARVLITGATGFIGSHLARACLARGDDVTVMARPSSSLERLESLAGRLDVRRLDLADAPAVTACLNASRPEIIFHAGARTRYAAPADLTDMAESVDDNLTPLFSLLFAAANASEPPRVLVRTGTIAEYGDTELPYTETQCAFPRNAYGASLLAGTQFMSMARSRLPFDAVTARLALTYGPGQSRDFLIPHLVDQLLKNETVTIARPDDRRDLIYVEDVVAALLQIADRPGAVGPVVNVCSSEAPRMSEVALMLLRATKAARDLVEISHQTSQPVELVCDGGHMAETLGWSAGVPLFDGLERTVQWAKHESQLLQPSEQRLAAI
ncbi:NAD(P)-dependent oxidoreductase [uncultured Roseobacter sp.]|uniref:NAD-dependent epimerase/dehydratase family protein n=1 Tax=uncultured Roseobacter sp. TaxID=114847 RepID=UPI00263710E8|nr:NAD(P)-dependent oxidoreductase [uncultured Roseobacter sp.]